MFTLPSIGNKKVLAFVGFLIFLIIASVFIYKIISRRVQFIKLPDLIKSQTASVYRLVPEKVSQSASVIINLPKGVNPNKAINNIRFEPNLEGQFLIDKPSSKADQFFFTKIIKDVIAQTSQPYQVVLFKPKAPLALNHRYQVVLDLLQQGIIKSEFLTVGDPYIEAVFPKDGSESPEDTKLTIIFNRPMTILTSLDQQHKIPVKIKISPEVKGKFRWTTTNTLQFIPEKGFNPATLYQVEIGQFTSPDNITSEARKVSFATRLLRILSTSEGNKSFRDPASIRFNQEVDLEKTKKEIEIKNLSSGKNIAFEATYGEKLSQKKSKTKIIDKSTILILNQSDSFGRPKTWDFDVNYSITVNKAHPLNGQLPLLDKKSFNITVLGFVKNVTTISKRESPYLAPTFFDPEGTLVVEFTEDIDLSKTVIKAPKFKEAKYGEKCIDEEYHNESDCSKTDDKKKILIAFDSPQFKLDDLFDLSFDKIVNSEGIEINKKPYIIKIASYPKFRILSTKPSANDNAADLSKLVICSNTPIAKPEDDKLKDHIKASKDFEIESWSKSWYVYPQSSSECNVGEFETQVGYRLMPTTSYQLNLVVDDVFGQSTDHSFTFKSGPLQSRDLSLNQLQGGFIVTKTGKTVLNYAAINMDYVDVDICRLEPKDFLYYLKYRIPYYTSSDTITRCSKRASQKIELPKKHWVRKYFQVDSTKEIGESKGFFIITLTHPDYKGEYWVENKKKYSQIYERTYLNITELAVGAKKINAAYESQDKQFVLSSDHLEGLSNLYWVTNISDQKAIENAKVVLYKAEANNLVEAGSFMTDSKGIAKAKATYDLSGAVVIKDDDATVVEDDNTSLDWSSTATEAVKHYIYFDKPIYRPGQTVFIKGIYRVGYDGLYEVYKEKAVPLQVFNSKNDQIFNQSLDVSDYGTYNTSLTLDTQAPLGEYRACVVYTCYYFDVEEYKPSPFDLKAKSQKDEYISKDQAIIDVAANYYFGAPLSEGKVTYTLSAQDYYFDKFEPGGYRFGGGSGYYWYDNNSYNDTYLTRGDADLDSLGRATVKQVIDFDKLITKKEKRVSKIIVFDINLTNSQGQTVSQQNSFITHAASFYLGFSYGDNFLGKNQASTVKVKSVDTQGHPTKIDNLKFQVYKVDWVFAKRQDAGGGYSNDWERRRIPIKEESFSTDNNGDYSTQVSFDKEGEYEIEVSGRDNLGNTSWVTDNYYVYGENTASVMPQEDNKLEVLTGKKQAEVGESVDIVIKSPVNKAKALITSERGQIFNYDVIDLVGSMNHYKLDIKPEFAPNIFFTALAHSNLPDARYGQVEIVVGQKTKKFNIKILPDKQEYLPGEDVVLNLIANSFDNKPVSAELSLAVVDMSILALKGNPKKEPVTYFYSGFPQTITTLSNLKIFLKTIPIPTSGGKGGGGMGEDELAKKKRGVFKETAFYEPKAYTDSQGRATIKFTLPDNLTTWQAESVGVTKDTLLGVGYKELLSRKNLMINPLRPRFIIPGDTFFLGADIFNQTNQSQSLSISLSAPTLTILDSKSSDLTLKAKSDKTVYFKVKAPTGYDKTSHVYSLTAKAKDFEDQVEQTIPLVSDNTYESVATAGIAKDKATESVFIPPSVVKDRGTLQVRASATLAVVISNSLNEIIKNSANSFHFNALSLKAVAIVKKISSLPNIKDKIKIDKIKVNDKEQSLDEYVKSSLMKIINSQNPDGGFSYYPLWPSDYHLTMDIIEALAYLTQAGYDVDTKTINRATEFAYQSFFKEFEISNKENNTISLAYVLAMANRLNNYGQIKNLIEDLSANDLFIKDKISNLGLVKMAYVVSSFNSSTKSKIFTTLENRIQIDGRGAFLDITKTYDWRNFETAITNTSHLLKAEIAGRSNYPTDRLVRWLMASTNRTLLSNSYRDTISIIDAFADYLSSSHETEADYNLVLAFDGKSITEKHIDQANIFDTLNQLTPISKLSVDKNIGVSLIKSNDRGKSSVFYYDMILNYYLEGSVPARDEGFAIVRSIHDLNDIKNEQPIASAKLGDVVRIHLELSAPETSYYVVVEDYIPAGLEPVNLDLATEQKSLRLQDKEFKNIDLAPEYKEIRDSKVYVVKKTMTSGDYEFDYFARAQTKGQFSHPPAIIYMTYFPERFGRSASSTFEVK